jgi:polar amino acid transport system substrate-binding protein
LHNKNGDCKEKAEQKSPLVELPSEFRYFSSFQLLARIAPIKSKFQGKLPFYTLHISVIYIALIFSLFSGREHNPVPQQSSFEMGQHDLFTAEERAYLNRKKVIRMTTDPDWMPFDALDRDGKHQGIASDLIKLMSERGKISIQLIPSATWEEALDLVRDRKCDMLSLAAPTPQREKYLLFTTPVVEVQAVVATLFFQPFIGSIADLSYKKVGVIRGYSHVELLKQQNEDIRLVELDNYAQGLAMLQRGDLYGIAGNMASIGWAIQESKMSNVKIAGRLEGDVKLCVPTRSDEPLLHSIFQKLVDSLTEEEKQAIMNKWLSVRYEHQTDRKLLFGFMGGAILMGFGLTVWFFKLRQLNQGLKEVNTRLEELNTNKNYYFSVIGHDLRNPFMSIAGLSEELRQQADKLSPQEIRKLSSVITDRAELALGMLNQLLEWARLELQQYVKSSEAVDLHRVANDVIRLFQMNATTKGVKLRNEIPVASILKTDPTMLAVVLRNLVSNAIKYSRFNDIVTIGWEKEQAMLFVKDSGVGMTPGQVAELFKDKPNKSLPGTGNEHGTGLGITICRRYAHEMQAEFRISSVPDKGSTFFLKFS